MSLDFMAAETALSAAAAAPPLARSPMERQATAAGARVEARDGWNVAVAYGDPQHEATAIAEAGAWIDVSAQGKFELQAAPDVLTAFAADAGEGATLELGRATRARGAWWCPLTPDRALVLCPPAATAELRDRLAGAVARTGERASVVDVTTQYAALTLCGPPAREIFARFCALDLRPRSLPVRGLRPGSVARTPGLVLRETEQRFLMLFGWALGEYMWTVVEDAGRHLGARPAGVDVLEPLDVEAPEAAPHA